MRKFLPLKYKEVCHTYYKHLHENKAVPGLLPDIELLKKMFPTILDMKNANRAQKNFFQKIVRKNIWGKVFKNGTSKVCGRQPLKYFAWSILEYFVPNDPF